MLNVRKLKEDFSQNVLREGKELFKNNKVFGVKILNLDAHTIRISAKIKGQYQNYDSEIEIDRVECGTVDSDCDCHHRYDCQHLAAMLFYLEEYLEDIFLQYSKERGLDTKENNKEEIFEVIKSNESKRKVKQYRKELVKEYVLASEVLAHSPFFIPVGNRFVEKADIAIIFSFPEKIKKVVEIQIALRLPYRSKPLHILWVKDFLDGIRYEEEITIGENSYFFTEQSFKEEFRGIVRMLVDYARVSDKLTSDKGQRSAFMEMKLFGQIFSEAHSLAIKQASEYSDNNSCVLPCIYENTLEFPTRFSLVRPAFDFSLECIAPPISKILVDPAISLGDKKISLEDVKFFECLLPGMIYDHVYYKFADQITRKHLIMVKRLREVTIPKPLFGTFVENSMMELSRFGSISNAHSMKAFNTIPFTGQLKGICTISFLDGELEASIEFLYDSFKIPAIPDGLTFDHLDNFIKDGAILARDLVGEKKILEDIFSYFLFNKESGNFCAKSWKKIVKFMTEIIPKYKNVVEFKCPRNLLDQFVYDQSKFKIVLSYVGRVDVFEVSLEVEGSLNGVKLESIWECVLSKKTFIERNDNGRVKILVLDLPSISRVVHLFDEMGIKKLVNHKFLAPIWSIVNIDEEKFQNSPIYFSISDNLKEIQKQMRGEVKFKSSAIPTGINADLRPYQLEGVAWLERLRSMHLNGILADDMGLGKTIQTLVSLTQNYQTSPFTSMIICPTSLLYNWKEEINKFIPSAKVMVIDGTKSNRVVSIRDVSRYQFVITSYSLLQKDVVQYADLTFNYIVLDEAQNIKNRVTRNAKVVKKLKSDHKLVLSGTPVENSLEELWSLFDFLMPKFLGSYDRFVEKYVRAGVNRKSNLDYLKKKISPFVLRRMKRDVLHDLPAVSEIVYHCQLTEGQKKLYTACVISAKDELTRLVEKNGFEKVKMQVLATLTRLKQICCHPALFAKENAEDHDSAKYEMLMELLEALLKGNHKVVIFSQYTKMLKIMEKDIKKHGIHYSYLDGSVKNRLAVVKDFNEDLDKQVFLISLKSGGVGLNLVGADTVIHYDMWWNPAVESQATDRVHRMGQKRNVSVYKMITLNSIEEKILEMQGNKKKLMKQIINTDNDIISSLTWEDVLSLLEP